MRGAVAIVYTPQSQTPHNEYVSEEQIEMIGEILRRQELTPVPMQFDPDVTPRSLAANPPRVVLNLAYGWVSRGRERTLQQPEVMAMLEEVGPPVVGSPASVQRLVQDKLLTGRAVRAMGLHAPVELPERDQPLPELAVVKPRFGACHRGVKLLDPRTLAAVDEQQFVLQEYIPGEEFTVGVLEEDGVPRALTPIAVRFVQQPAVMDWDNYRFDFEADPSASRLLHDAAIAAFKGLGFRDYARFDFRMKGSTAVLLDANSLPNLHPKISLFPMAARSSGLSYDDIIVTLVANAARRAGQQREPQVRRQGCSGNTPERW